MPGEKKHMQHAMTAVNVNGAMYFKKNELQPAQNRY